MGYDYFCDFLSRFSFSSRCASGRSNTTLVESVARRVMVWFGGGSALAANMRGAGEHARHASSAAATHLPTSERVQMLPIWQRRMSRYIMHARIAHAADTHTCRYSHTYPCASLNTDAR